MGFLAENCLFVEFTERTERLCNDFDCGNDDLNNFFRNRAVPFSDQRLSLTYGFVLADGTQEVVCAFSLSNHSVQTSGLSNNRRRVVNRHIPYAQQMSVYPGVLVGRLAVSKNFQRLGIGSELMRYLRLWFLGTNNKSGCCFVVLDALNQSDTIEFYLRNGFQFLYQSELEEAARLGRRKNAKIETRGMFRDLLDTSEGMR